MASTRSPSQAEVLNRAIARGQRELHVSLPVQVLAYDPKAQTVNVQPLLSEAYEDTDGVLQLEVLPVINAVPVAFPAGGTFRITFPVQAGDQGMVVFCDRSIDGWALHGGPQQSRDLRMHHLADAWFVPGVRPKGAWGSADGAVITIGDDGLAGDFVATAQRVLTQLQNIVTAFNSHTHAVPSLGTSAPPTTPMGSPTPPASETVKVLG